MSGRPVVAAFDFDGTITYRDTLLPFLLRLAGWGALLRAAVVMLPTLLGYGLRLIPNGVAKERVLQHFLAGMDDAALRRAGEDYARAQLPVMVRPAALARLHWHQRQGHRCVVISASIEHYVAPWARAAGFHDCLATRLAQDGAGRLSGHYAGENCYGAEKERRLRQLLGGLANVEIYAYGDSRGDRELLALADHAYYRTMPGEGDGA